MSVEPPEHAPASKYGSDDSQMQTSLTHLTSPHLTSPHLTSLTHSLIHSLTEWRFKKYGAHIRGNLRENKQARYSGDDCIEPCGGFFELPPQGFVKSLEDFATISLCERNFSETLENSRAISYSTS
jgi:hypothetical protein